jgi:adenine-specific DNA-methyltransferase
MFFQPKNGMRVDAIRDEIEKLKKYDLYHSAYLVSLMEAADRVDNTTGVQMAYLKHWCKRSHNDLRLRLLDLPIGPVGKAVCGRAEDFFYGVTPPYDVVYMDPPYNQHNYRGNYHIWETLCRWDQPEAYGKARKRIDIKDKTCKSDFNFKKKAHVAMLNIIQAVKAKYIVVSFNNEGYISRDEMISMLQTRGNVEVSTHAYDRYVGAKIGIHDLDGNKVGAVSHLKNKEYIFICEVTK